MGRVAIRELLERYEERVRLEISRRRDLVGREAQPVDMTAQLDQINAVVLSVGRTCAQVAARHGVKAQIEAFPMAKANEAIEKVKKNKVRYRAVLAN